KGEEQVAPAAAAGPCLTLPGDAHLDVLVDAGGALHLERLAHLDASLPVAGLAGMLDDPPLAVAARTGGDVDHLAEDRLHAPPHLAGPLALRAGGRSGA